MAKNKLKVAVIREELVELTGDAIAALILNQAVYHHHAIEDMDNSTQEFIAKLEDQGAIDLAVQAKNNLRNGWFYKSPNSFYKEIMISSRSTVIRRLDKLVEMGYLIKGGQNLGFANVDDTWWKVDIQKIRKDLAKLGFTLNGYPMWNDTEELIDEQSEQRIDVRGVHGGRGTSVRGVHGGRGTSVRGVHGGQGGVHGGQGGVHGGQGGVHGGHHLKNTTKENFKDFSSSSEVSRESIDNELKEKYPNVPFEIIKQELLNDSTVVINTFKQYKSLLDYRLKNWKAKSNKQDNRPKKINNQKTIRKEPIPEWLENPDKYYQSSQLKTLEEQEEFEKKKAQLKERLRKYEKVE